MYAKLERKMCTKCKELKTSDQFTLRSDRPTKKACWCKSCLNEWRRQAKVKNAKHFQDYEFERGLKRFYGMNPEQYEELLNKQNGCCACCGIHGSKFKRRLHVDHDHETGIVRALLCTECNPGIGYFKHSIERLEMAISYLNKFKSQR